MGKICLKTETYYDLETTALRELAASDRSRRAEKGKFLPSWCPVFSFGEEKKVRYQNVEVIQKYPSPPPAKG